MIPAKQVGGDFFDFFPIDENRLSLLIADVSGKSISGALFMAMSRAIIKTISTKTDSPASCLYDANEALCINNESCMFVTAFYAVYDSSSGSIVCANAGHNPPFILHPDGDLSEIARCEGLPLGVQEGKVYDQHFIKLSKGETLILYTDGITEAMNKNKELYGEQRFKESIISAKDKPLSEISTIILDGIENFTQGAENSDDITFLMIKQLT